MKETSKMVVSTRNPESRCEKMLKTMSSLLQSSVRKSDYTGNKHMKKDVALETNVDGY